jgi:hypothetical protein
VTLTVTFPKATPAFFATPESFWVPMHGKRARNWGKGRSKAAAKRRKRREELWGRRAAAEQAGMLRLAMSTWERARVHRLTRTR